MSKTADTEVILVAGLAIGAVYLLSKLVGGAVDVVKAAGQQVDSVLNPLGLQVSDDPSIARWVIDHPNGGWVEASRWFTYTALMQARQLPESSGTPPPSGSDLFAKFPPFSGTSGGW